MALITKVNPIGIDIPIDTVQRALYTALVTNGNWQNYQSYHRAYKNTRGDGVVPEIFDTDKDYKESFFDDKYDVVSMFIADDIRPEFADTDFKSDISIIFHVNLESIIDTVTTHRADEEFIWRRSRSSGCLQEPILQGYCRCSFCKAGDHESDRQSSSALYVPGAWRPVPALGHWREYRRHPRHFAWLDPSCRRDA